jgi:hypothetical protein
MIQRNRPALPKYRDQCRRLTEPTYWRIDACGYPTYARQRTGYRCRRILTVVYQKYASQDCSMTRVGKEELVVEC